MDAVHGAGDGLPLGEHEAAPALVIDPSADTLQADGALGSAGYLRRLQLIGASLNAQFSAESADSSFVKTSRSPPFVSAVKLIN